MSGIKKVISLVLVCTMLMTTVAGLGSVFSSSAAAATPTWTNPISGTEYAIGNFNADSTGRGVKTPDEMSKAYDSEGRWAYVAADIYEIEKDYQESGALYEHMSLTDGYVDAGSYVFVAVTEGLSSTLYSALPTFYFSFSYDFFNAKTGSAVATGNGLETDLANVGATNHYAYENTATEFTDEGNSNITGDVGYYIKYTRNDYAITSEGYYNNTGMASMTGVDPSNMANICCVGYKSTSYKTVFKVDSSTWLFGFVLQVKEGLEDGTTGGIWCAPEMYARNGETKPTYVPAAQTATNMKVLGKLNTNNSATATNGVAQTTVAATTPQVVHFEDFGGALCVGKAPEGKTYNAAFKSADGETTLYTYTDVAKVETMPASPEAPSGKYFAGWIDKDGEIVTFPLTLTENSDFFASFKDLPTWTNPISGTSYTVGNFNADSTGRGVKTPDEMSKAYDSEGRWAYVAADIYEIEKDYQESGALYEHMSLTDGYVDAGSYVFVAVTEGLSSTLYSALPTFYFSFSYDFFNAKTGSAVATGNGLETDLANVGATNHYAYENTATEFTDAGNSNITGDVGYYIKYTRNDYAITSEGYYNNTGMASMTGVDPSNMANICCVGYKSTSYKTVFKVDSSTWLFGFVLQVKEGLEDGTTGGIWCAPEMYARNGETKPTYVPAAQTATNMKVLGKLNTNNSATATNGVAQTTVAATTPQVVHFEDFGGALCVGEAPTVPTGAEKYKATFYNGSTVVSELEYSKGEKVEAPEDPTSETQYFYGWSTAANDESAIVSFPQTMGTEAMNFYAIWSDEKVYTATFQDESGKVLDTVKYRVSDEDGFKIGIDEIKKTGYEFDYWEISGKDLRAYGWDTSIRFTADAASDITLISRYKASLFTITMELNGGSMPEDYEEGNTFQNEYGTLITPPSVTPEKAGYLFIGWSKSAKATAADENLGTVPANNNTKIYAVWIAKTYEIKLYASKDAAEPFKTCTATYNATLGTNAPKASEKPAAPSEGKAFGSWNNKADDTVMSTTFTTPLGTAQTKYTIDGDLELYIDWIDCSTLTFMVINSEGKFVPYKTVTDKDGTVAFETITSGAITAKTSEGINYNSATAKWYTDETLTEVAFNGKGVVPSTSETFTFGGTTEYTSTYVYLGKPNQNIKVYDNEECTGTPIYETSQYATLDNAEGTTIGLDRSKLDASTPTGKQITGFKDMTTGKSVTYTASNQNYYIEKLFGLHKLVPQYEPIIYTIVLSDGKSGAIAQVKVPYGETLKLDGTYEIEYTGKATSLPEVGDDMRNYSKSSDLEGFMFKNWYFVGTDITFIDEVTIDDEFIERLHTVQGATSTTFTAWVSAEAGTFTATFNLPEGAQFANGETTAEIGIKAGTTAEAIIEALKASDYGMPTKEGYIFQRFDPNNKMPGADTTFTAVFVASNIKVTYKYSEEGYWQKDYSYGMDGSKLADEEFSSSRWSELKIFTGWELTEGELAEDGTIKEDMTYTAQYNDFSDYLLILYDTNIADLDKVYNEEDGTFNAATNESIYMTVTKKLKVAFYSGAKEVSFKEAVLNPSSDTVFIILFDLKFNNFNIKNFFSKDMWDSVFITARPITLPLALFTPQGFADTVKLAITAISSLLGGDEEEPPAEEDTPADGDITI